MSLVEVEYPVNQKQAKEYKFRRIISVRKRTNKQLSLSEINICYEMNNPFPRSVQLRPALLIQTVWMSLKNENT